MNHDYPFYSKEDDNNNPDSDSELWNKEGTVVLELSKIAEAPEESPNYQEEEIYIDEDLFVNVTHRRKRRLNNR